MKDKTNKNLNLNMLIFPIVMLLSGICMVIFGSNMLNIALYIIGVLFLVSGIITLVRKDVIPGVINLVIGIVIILLGSLLINIAVLVIGIILLVVGIVSIVKLFVDKKVEILNFVGPIIMVLVGILLVCGNFFTFVDLIIKAAGICLIIFATYKLLFTIFYEKLKK